MTTSRGLCEMDEWSHLCFTERGSVAYWIKHWAGTQEARVLLASNLALVTSPLCSSVLSSVKWGNDTALLCKVL